jgi:diguanylate cyclase (GGDEF)-like protein
VGWVNHWLARGVVGARLQELAVKMRRVEDSLVGAATSGDWSDCDPENCMVTVESDDDLGQVGVSFNNLVASLAASHRVADGVSAVSRALAAHLDLHDLADTTLRELSARTGCEGAALLSVTKGRVDLAGSFGVSDPDQLISSEPVLRVLRTGEPAQATLPPDVVVTTALLDFVPQEVRVIPVRTGVVTVGVLLVAWLTVPPEEITTVLKASLPGLGVALNNALNHEDLQRVAALDPLTGCYNRRFGMQRLSEEFSRSARSGEPLGVLMMDLDRFKVINDTYGHLVGDRVLQAATRAARQSLREGDVSIRYGGEEFLLVMPAAGMHDLSKAAERVRRAVADAEIREAGQRIPITVSIGGACLPDSRAIAATDLIELADKAVYAAKTSGRDRYVIS